MPPRSLTDVAALRDVLLSYSDTNALSVMTLWSISYIALQTCAVPGTIFLSILAGSLWGVGKGLSIVSIIATIGSCSCYTLSRLVGRRIVIKAWPQRVAKFAKEVDKRRQELLFYIIFLRVTPLLPNTFINVAAPIVGVPLLPFALGECVC
jgi:uncharacterized membrane protein YdjX (TVP38/TMEM64 family)